MKMDFISDVPPAALAGFHPLIAGWFNNRFGQPTEPQLRGWPEILAGRNTLIAAPTGSGKTLAAFLVCIDGLLRQAIDGELSTETQVIYVSPLKALSNDIRRNLEVPLAEICAAAQAAGYELPPLRVQARTGDTPSSQRVAMLKRPPHILVTTPESLYLLLTSPKSRETLRNVRTVILDEIHALARDKRGSHLALSLERLEALCPIPPVRIGLSATQQPIEEIARFLVGTHRVSKSGQPECTIIDAGHTRDLDLAVEVPATELSAVCSQETWGEIYERIGELIRSHRSTVIFVNTRRMAERVSYQLSELLGEDAVASHHGSLSKEIRQSAEERLQTGQLKAIVATASLELGIDIGLIDLVCQIGSPRAIATFLQRVGRSGHSLGLLPKGRLFALTRDELLECFALVRAVRARRLDRIEIPIQPIDILAQQIVATAAADEWDDGELYNLMRGAWPYRDLSRAVFDNTLDMLAHGVAPNNRRGSLVHWDQIQHRVKARRGARLTALTSGGAIPETADYRVVTEEDRTLVGSVNEDFAIESLAGDVFLLGNTSWRIRYVRGGEVVVKDAQGAPASIPFWLGEAPGRTIELSDEVSRLRLEISERPAAEMQEALQSDCGASGWGAAQALNYIAAQKAAIDVLPTTRRILFERFFDESGGMQLVIHAPLGARINRAWGLALRKRFCRSFDFELQASADDNGIVLSLGPQHSFPLEQMFRMLNSQNGESLLVQALLAVPMFKIRWRWNITRALAVLRQDKGKKVPPHLQRFRADDLLSSVFPMASACLENVVGDIEIPDHPLVKQTVYDCLHEAMDLDRWLHLLSEIEKGEVELVGRDTREPSPFSHQLLNANPYAFLDPAPLEERRARAVFTRRSLGPDTTGDLSWLDPQAIALVAADAWPVVRDADELCDALLNLVALPAEEGSEWKSWFRELKTAGRATELHLANGPVLWVAAETLSLVRAAYPGATCKPALSLPASLEKEYTAAQAWVALVRGRMEHCGPVTANQVATTLGLAVAEVQSALEALEGEGAVLRGKFQNEMGSPGIAIPGSVTEPTEREIEWCDRRLLARIHRLTLDGARRQIQPATTTEFWRFLAAWQHVAPGTQLDQRPGLLEAVSQLQGNEIAACAWERDVLPARVTDYDPGWLDELSLSGEIAWGRLQPPRRTEEDGPSGSGLTRVAPISLVARSDLNWLLPPDRADVAPFARSNAQLVLESLSQHGASFWHDLAGLTGLLPTQLDEALSELSALGLVTADGFASIRKLVSADRPKQSGRRKSRRTGTPRRSYSPAGRWSSFPGKRPAPERLERLERWARQLLRRYGVVFRDLLSRESVAPAWYELVPIFRRWEARGEIRGGRFVSGVAGEQYASTEAIEQLRRTRQAEPTGRWFVVSASDPLNLVGILGPGPRLPSTPASALALQDGRVIATQRSGEIAFHIELPPEQSETLARALRMSTVARLRHAAAIEAAKEKVSSK
jgi:ATP-dependent Lhr-like helicase